MSGIIKSAISLDNGPRAFNKVLPDFENRPSLQISDINFLSPLIDLDLYKQLLSKLENKSDNKNDNSSWHKVLESKIIFPSLDDNTILESTDQKSPNAFRGVGSRVFFDEYFEKYTEDNKRKLERKALAAVKIQKKFRDIFARNYYDDYDGYINRLILDEGYDFAKRISKSRAKIDTDFFKIQDKKPDLTTKQKTAQVSLSVVSSFVGAVIVFEGWMKFMASSGFAGVGLSVSSPSQVIPLAFSGFITSVSYFVNYNLYKAKIGDCFYKKEDINNNNVKGKKSTSFYVLQKLVKGLMIASISIYTFAFFLASFQSEFLVGDFCKKFMDSSALNGDSFLQLLTSTPVGIAFSSVFLVFAVLSAGCQFYFAASSIIKQSPTESFEKIKSYFNKMFIGGNNKYKLPSEDLHAKLNLEIYKLKKENIGDNKKEEKEEKEEVEKFRKVLSRLEINEKAKLLVVLKKLQSGVDIGAIDLSLEAVSRDLTYLGVCLKNTANGVRPELYCKKTKLQVSLESGFKVASVVLFVLGTVSLVSYLGPLVLSMFPALLALKVVFGVSCASIFLARMPVSLESGFWGSARLANIICNFDEFKFKWKYNTGRFKCLGSYGLLIEKTSLNALNAIANMAFAFFSASSGGMTYVFGVSLFYLSLAITMKPSFEDKNLNVLGGVIHKVKPSNDPENNNQNPDNAINGGFWSRMKKRVFGRNNNLLNPANIHNLDAALDTKNDTEDGVQPRVAA